jgi:hypothetical protein
MDKSNDDANEQLKRITDAVLGPDEDFLERENYDEFLLALGIDSATLLSEFKEHLENRARHYQSETMEVPNSIVGALRVLRERIQSSDPSRMDPNSYINALLSGGLGHERSVTFARAFRRESDDELCVEDQKLLDDLEAELEDDQVSDK